MDYDEGTPHEKIVELLTEAIPLHTHSCMFQNKSEMEDLHFNGYVELNVSYRLTASNSSACVFTPCQSGETCQVSICCDCSLTNAYNVFHNPLYMQWSCCLLTIYTCTHIHNTSFPGFGLVRILL